MAAGWQAVLVDVRTDAEREWVGKVPGAVAVAWKQWPGMAANQNFDAELRAAVPEGKKVVLLCRSGVRSVAAAQRAAGLGIEAYNILEGFEGDVDASRPTRPAGWLAQARPALASVKRRAWPAASRRTIAVGVRLCQRHVSAHMVSRSCSACQPRVFRA
jgi:rhodanese-related sulfurtransferase